MNNLLDLLEEIERCDRMLARLREQYRRPLTRREVHERLDLDSFDYDSDYFALGQFTGTPQEHEDAIYNRAAQQAVLRYRRELVRQINSSEFRELA